MFMHRLYTIDAVIYVNYTSHILSIILSTRIIIEDELSFNQ